MVIDEPAMAAAHLNSLSPRRALASSTPLRAGVVAVDTVMLGFLGSEAIKRWR
jgi:hypothetical protein